VAYSLALEVSLASEGRQRGVLGQSWDTILCAQLVDCGGIAAGQLRRHLRKLASSRQHKQTANTKQPSKGLECSLAMHVTAIGGRGKDKVLLPTKQRFEAVVDLSDKDQNHSAPSSI